MNKVILTIGTMILLLGGTSCSDFLEENPTTELSKEAIYGSEENVLSVLNGAYSTMAAYNSYAFRYYHVLSTTSGMFVSTKSNEIPMTSLKIESNDVNVEELYRAQYKTIGVANDILANLPGSTIKEDVKNRVIGEASFIRALTYFNLVRLFGPVSLITQPVESFEQAHFPRTAVAEVYKQIITDLDSAYSKLPVAAVQQVGRPHKFAAKALLAKVYLTMAGNDDASEYWEKAYTEAKAVYDSQSYGLVTPFASVFDISNKNNKEVIFSIQFHSNQGGMSLTETCLPSRNYLTPNATVSNVWGKTRPCKDVFDLFGKTYPNDPRIDATFLHTKYYKLDVKKDINIYPSKTKTNGQNNDDIEYPFIKKYVDPGYVTSSSCNFIYYRYADLLLVLAEAANETGRTAEAVGYVNEVLSRARDKNGNSVSDVGEVSPAAWATTLTKEQVRDKIMTERQIELLGEADEWYTVRRRGADFLKAIIERHNNHPAIKDVATLARYVYRYPSADVDIKRNMLLPFPANEIARNEAISQEEQNFGY